MNRSKALASSSVGFFQEPPSVSNQYEEDASLHHATLLFLPPEIATRISLDLSSFGARVLSRQVQIWLKDAEQNPPKLETWDTWGRRKEELVTSNGWQQLQAMGIRAGIVAIPYENQHKQYSRLYQFLKYHLWSASSALVTCPSAMTDGAAALLRRRLDHTDTMFPQSTEEAVLKSAYVRLTSRNPNFAWTSGQWMTERPGGSNVRDTETRASLASLDSTSNEQLQATDSSPLGPWRIDGFKWFSSATDADMTVMLARTAFSGSREEQISAFFAPTKCRPVNPSQAKDNNNTIQNELPTIMNGIRPQRLKNKLGTRPLPTAELELNGMRAYLLGKQGQGVREISTVLNITRLYNSVSAMGGWGRGLAVSRAFARVRRIGGRPLIEVPAHARDMAQQHVMYRAYMLFTYFVVALIGAVENAARSKGEFVAFVGVQSTAQAAQLLRLLTPVLKATTAQAAISGLRYCMESMGGVGYLENEDPLLNVARLFRDSNVLAIWEGTTNVMAEDTIRVLRQKQPGHDTDTDTPLQTLANWSSRLRRQWRSPDRKVVESLSHEVSALQLQLLHAKDTNALLYDGQSIMDSIDFIVTMTLLCEDSNRHPDNLASTEIARRWPLIRGRQTDPPHRYHTDENWQKQAQMDSLILKEYDVSSARASTAKI